MGELLPPLRVGTCSFTAKGWETAFYPPGLKQAHWLAHYAEHFDTLEVDSTFYRVPAHSTVRKWNASTPQHFRFACKVTQSITHEKCLQDCDAELASFLSAMDALGEKLGAMLLQLPYFNKGVFATADDFMQRLEAFLKKLPKGRPWALEIRNKAWLRPTFFELLREHGVAYVAIDHPWMPRPAEVLDRYDAVTAPMAYVRLLGDRYKIEEQTKVWDTVVVERSREVAEWVEACRRIQHRGVEVLVYVNNHFSGFAPATAREFMEKFGGGRVKAAAAAESAEARLPFSV